MAKKPTTTRSIESDVSKELENALDLDLTESTGHSGISASMDDLEAQISQAADELVREGRNGQPAAARQPAQDFRPMDRPMDRPVDRPVDRPIERQAANQPATFAPANDDRQKDFRSLLHGLNKRASRTVYWVAALLSVLWLGACAALADRLFGSEIWQIRSLDQLVARPELVMFALGVLLPVVLIFAFAVMVRRAQEMRIAAQSMTEVAFRLAEPENLAQDRVMMVGQAVRREVSAMGEGIERTLARAVELETLVHTEVNQIERSYSENAARIRALVDGLGSEREAVVTHAERVRASITGAHETLRDEIGQASDIIRDSILNASTNLSMTITNSGDTLIDRINESGMHLFDSMDSRVDSITDRLTTSGEAFASLLDTRIAKLTDSTDNLTLDQRVRNTRACVGYRHGQAQRRARSPRAPDQRDAGRAREGNRHDLH
jgi:uncharacterized membrane protein YhaH (DUF805 family)